MSNSLIVTEYRDALSLLKTPPEKAGYIKRINDDGKLTENQKALEIERLKIIECEWQADNNFDSEEALIQIRERLKTALLPSSRNKNLSANSANDENHASAKWKKIQELQKVVLDSLPQSHFSNNRDEIKRKNMLAKVESLLDAAQKKRASLFEKLISSVEDEPQESSGFMDAVMLLHKLIEFRQSSKNKQGDDVGSQKALEKYIEFLKISTDEDLKKKYETLISSEMVALITAFFTQRHLHFLVNDLDGNSILNSEKNKKAFNDALSIWQMNKAWAKGLIIDQILSSGLKKPSEPIEEYARKDFLSIAGQLHAILSMTHDAVRAELESRKLLLPLAPQERPFYFEEWDWPKDKHGKLQVIMIADKEKKIVSDVVKQIAVGKNLSPSEKQKRYNVSKNMDVFYLGKMMRSLGYFNPMRFCDVLLTMSPDTIKKMVEESDAAHIKKVHNLLMSQDLNNLVYLFKNLQEGNKEARFQLYQMFGLNSNDLSIIDGRFEKLVDKLYESMDVLMQSVRLKLQVKEDYSYNDFELDSSRGNTAKNTACLKRILELYAGVPKRSIEYTWIDKAYLYWHSGENLEVNIEDVSVNVGFEDDELSQDGLTLSIDEETSFVPNKDKKTQTPDRKSIEERRHAQEKDRVLATMI